jgi:hypothetical protein
MPEDQSPSPTEPARVPDGGAAFPHPVESGVHNGMTLRDYFAAAALTGFMASPHRKPVAEMPKPLMARDMYALADAMLAARAAP